MCVPPTFICWCPDPQCDGVWRVAFRRSLGLDEVMMANAPWWDCCPYKKRKDTTLCDSMDCRTPGLPVHHQLQVFTQTHVHWVGDDIPLCPLFLSFFLSLEDIARRQPSANQEEGHGQIPNLPALRSWLFQLPELWEINACCLSHQVGSIWYSSLS